LGGWVVAVSLALGWGFGLLVLGGLLYRSLPAHDFGLSLWCVVCLWTAMAAGYCGFRYACLRMGKTPRDRAASVPDRDFLLAGILLLLLEIAVGAGTEGTLPRKDGFTLLPRLVAAQLAEADLTRKPAGTVAYEHRVKEFEPKYREREGTEDDTDLTRDRDFTTEAVARFNAPLDAPDLEGADLRNANMVRAFLPGADLRRADMQGAVLGGAQMQDADCSSATLRGALLQSATLTCKDDTLTQEQLELAVGDFRTVLPEGLTVVSCLEEAQLEEADIAAALAHHPEEGDFFRSSRAQIRAALLCPKDVKPVRLDYDPFERRYWPEVRFPRRR
jgi:hypothetical protein